MTTDNQPTPASELDSLMDKDPLLLSTQDIDSIIAYQRQARANFEAGVKTKKAEGPKKKLDLLAMGLIKPAEPIKRRI